jgi:hypothetical protein
LQEVEQAKQRQVQRIGLLQPGQGAGFKAGYAGEQQGSNTRQQMNDIQHGN